MLIDTPIYLVAPGKWMEPSQGVFNAYGKDSQYAFPAMTLDGLVGSAPSWQSGIFLVRWLHPREASLSASRHLGRRNYVAQALLAEKQWHKIMAESPCSVPSLIWTCYRVRINSVFREEGSCVAHAGRHVHKCLKGEIAVTALFHQAIARGKKVLEKVHLR